MSIVQMKECDECGGRVEASGPSRGDSGWLAVEVAVLSGSSQTISSRDFCSVQCARAGFGGGGTWMPWLEEKGVVLPWVVR